RLTPQLQLAAGDPRDIDQIVDEPHELIKLLRHHTDELLDLIGLLRSGGNELDGGGERGERIAQLMSERGQELILAASTFAQRLLCSLALCNLRLQRFVEPR